ncbi:hypothetical protein EPO34_03160 [Patescibacteria group bacterium]|nr:MAG: hypothetical protein EPO34_03160 [Patescibacteria group bacterium]
MPIPPLRHASQCNERSGLRQLSTSGRLTEKLFRGGMNLQENTTLPSWAGRVFSCRASPWDARALIHKPTPMKYLIIIGLLVALPRAPVRAEGTPVVVLSEVGWAGSSLSTADEYMELANLTDAPIDLSGYRLIGGGDILLPSGATLPARGTFVIANFAVEDVRSALSRTPDFVSTAVALSNSALDLTLVAPDGTVVDRAGDAGAPAAGKASSSGSGARSMVRALPFADGSLASSWRTIETADGMDEGLPDLGTPGVNDLAEAAVETPMPAVTDPVAAEVEPLSASDESSQDVVETPETVTEPVVAPPSDEPIVTEPVVEPAQENVVVLSDGEGPSVGQPPIEDPSSAVQTQDDTTTVIASEPIEVVATPVALMPTVFPPHTLQISELYPVPASGEDEFVEILNPYNNLIPLAGWTLRDASGAKTPLPDQLLGLGQTVVLKNPKGRLNNDGDALDLVAPDGSVNDAVAYGKDGQKAGRSFVRVEDHLELTVHPTPGEANVLEPVVTQPSVFDSEVAQTRGAVITPPPAVAQPAPATPYQLPPTPSLYVLPPVSDHPSDAGIRTTALVPARAQPVVIPKAVASARSAGTTAKSAPKKPSAAPSRVTVAHVAGMAVNKRVVVTATVTAAPGAIGKQLMAVQDETGGITVFKNDGAFPQLSLGDQVEIAGVVSSSRGMKRIRLDAKSAVRILDHEDAPEAAETSDPSGEDVGALIKMTGLLVKTSAGTAVETDAGATPVRLPAESSIRPGTRIEATGVLTSSDGKFSLLPRSAADVVALEAPAAQEHAAPTKGAGRGASGIALTTLVLAAVTTFVLRPHVQRLITHYEKRPALPLPAQAPD